jgi:signal transduction histidine kinase
MRVAARAGVGEAASIRVPDPERPAAVETLDHHKLEAIFQVSPAAMALWRGPGMVFEMVNPGYQAIFPGRRLLGRRFLEALPEFEGQPFMEYFERVLETGVPFVGREVLARHRGAEDGPLEDHYYDFTYARIDDQNGNPYGVYDHAVDVTERVLARRAMEESRRALEQTIAELRGEREMHERFVAMLSHDLRTPLAAAQMGAHLVARKAAGDPAIQRLASRIVENTERADQMIRDLLDVNRIRAGQALPIEPAPCRLGHLLSEVLDELRTIHGDRFVLRAHPEVEGVWSCGAVRRVVENLCNNAIKYGAPSRPVTVSFGAFGGSAWIEVHNAGVPIPAEDLPHLFDAFRRTANAERGGQRGWGLGLALIKGIAEAHGGGVRVESSAERGTSFRVVLPLDARVSGRRDRR